MRTLNISDFFRVLPLAVTILLASGIFASAEDAKPILHVRKIANDFKVTGEPDGKAWKDVAWTPLRLRTGEHDGYAARVKMQYSATGIYVLMDSTDRKITASIDKDFENLWTEDVFEFFFWTDEQWPVYVEATHHGAEVRQRCGFGCEEALCLAKAHRCRIPGIRP